MEIPGYEIRRLIGQGGMATAYLAEQISLSRQVVLKVLDASVKESPDTVERFLNEGRIIASLNHPHIITIYDIGQSGDHLFISMEFVEGGDLKQRMQHKVFAPVEAIDILEKVAAGLSAAHESGIVHRDVKPGNILFRRDGTALLSDFGIAKRLSGDSDLTSTGMFVGSPNYMAPEQSEAGPIDGRADIYALGVILYEMLTGSRAYSADSVIDVILMHKKAPVPTLPPGLEQFQELLNLMMAKDRNDRFRDARSLIHYIEQMRRSGSIVSKVDMTIHPDFDVTGENEVDAVGTATRLHLEQPAPGLGRKLVLAGLAICVAGWLVLLGLERWMREPEVPDAIVQAPLETAGAPAMAVPLPATGAADAGEVAGALLWLGQHSLSEFRLTAPPQDNAYYYFTRLLQLDPGNARARAGMREIANRFAILAERAIAEGDVAQARSYIALGRQIDPENASLGLLEDMSTESEVGFFDALASFFR